MVMQEGLIRALDYMESHLEEDISVAEIALQAGYSQFYFSRQFTLHTCCAPYDYLMKRRLAKARQLLCQPGQRIIDVALSLCFGSHEAFSRCFKKHYGVNPSQRGGASALLDMPRIGERELPFLSSLRPVRCVALPGSVYFTPAAAGKDRLLLLNSEERGVELTLSGGLEFMEPEALHIKFQFRTCCEFNTPYDGLLESFMGQFFPLWTMGKGIAVEVLPEGCRLYSDTE